MILEEEDPIKKTRLRAVLKRGVRDHVNCPVGARLRYAIGMHDGRGDSFGQRGDWA